MLRREALARVAALMGSSLSAPTLAAVLTACDRNSSTKEASATEKFSPELEKLVEEAADTILPATSTPGAKAAGVGPFIVLMMNDCYPADARSHFLAGLNSLNDAADQKYNKSFVACATNERVALLNEAESAAHAARDKEREEAEKKKNQPQSTDNKGKEEQPPLPNYFFTLKELTLLGYFTSEPGATKALAYDPVPGRYDGCMDLQPNQKAWAL